MSATLGHKGVDTTVKHYIALNDKRLDKFREKHPAFKEKKKRKVIRQQDRKITQFKDVIDLKKRIKNKKISNIPLNLF